MPRKKVRKTGLRTFKTPDGRTVKYRIVRKGSPRKKGK